ncbi:hypothetical protein QOT17_012778 [Balamuthia mandrillaris]
MYGQPLLGSETRHNNNATSTSGPPPIPARPHVPPQPTSSQSSTTTATNYGVQYKAAGGAVGVASYHPPSSSHSYDVSFNDNNNSYTSLSGRGGDVEDGGTGIEFGERINRFEEGTRHATTGGAGGEVEYVPAGTGSLFGRQQAKRRIRSIKEACDCGPVCQGVSLCMFLLVVGALIFALVVRYH